MSSIKLKHYDVTSCKQHHLIEKHNWCKGVSTCYNHRKFGKVLFINEGVIAFSKKVHVFLRHPVYFRFSITRSYVVSSHQDDSNEYTHTIYNFQFKT